MNLSQFLSKLTSGNVQITVKDLESGSEIINLKASGYTALDDALEAREVMQWSVVTATHIEVVLGEALP